MITLPSCDIIRPAPTPNSASESLNPRLVQFNVDRGDQDESCDHDRGETDLYDEPRRKAGGQLRAGERGDEHRHRHRQQPLTGLEGIETQDDLQVDRKDEERAHQHQLLRHQRGQTRAQRLDAQQRTVE